MQYLLEIIGIVLVSEERNRVCEHPDVTATAIVVRFRPFTIFVTNR